MKTNIYTLSAWVVLATYLTLSQAKELYEETGSSLASASTYEDDLAERCCTVYEKEDFWGESYMFCLEDQRMQQAFDLTSISNTSGMGSVWCSPKVEARVCPGGSVEIVGGEDNKIECEAEGGEVETGYQVGSREYANSVPLTMHKSTIILEQHPWVAKGETYLSYSRAKKQEILREKILEDPTIGPWNNPMFYQIDLNTAFDYYGDELDCRFKTTHSQGNIGEVEWIDKGGHPYTGLFKGADTGFVRTSDVFQPNPTPSPQMPWLMVPAIAVKLLRDGMDSGNQQAQIYGRSGQFTYNFFEQPLTSLVRATPFDPISVSVGEFIGDQVTDFIGGLGHSHFARHDQYGVEVTEPVFPFQLHYEPTGDLNFPEDTFEPTTFEYLQTIPVGSILYTVHALDKPEELGGTWLEIGELKLKSQLVTSFWADRKMYFRHHRIDDDFVIKPEWAPYGAPYIPDSDREYILRPQVSQVEYQCPFAWIFENTF